jgi:putative solute:sodium symporter small subunit
VSLDRKYLVWALCFAAVGLGLGIFMAATNNHSELVTHAHILLIGFVVSFVYGIIHKLWLTQPNRAVANFQFVLHQASAITISVGLFLLYGNMVEVSKVDPILGVASFGVLLGMLLMIYMVVKSGPRKSVA